MAKIGTDEWVAEAEDRAQRAKGLRGVVARVWDPLPLAVRPLPFLVFCAVFPFMTSSEYVQRVALNTLLFAMLALGLNVVVGWAGLLDLGYVAFYGFGGYVYAALASPHFHTHLPTLAVLVIVVIASAMLGFLLGLPSRRLVGDYLAIVTLFFAQIFVVLTTNGNRITFPGRHQPTDITGGPNGIPNVDQFNVFGIHFASVRSYYWLALVSTVAIALMLWLLNRSRTGRAWRSIREDELAAELMSMPKARLKLLAFAFGAGIAGFTGTIFAAVQTAVFPTNFAVPLLITIYAMVILGGAGSLAGVVIGAIVINAILEILSTPDNARYAFYAAIVVGTLTLIRPRWRVAALWTSTVVFGIVVFHVADAIDGRWTSGKIEGAWLGHLLDGWVVHPKFPDRFGRYAFVALIVAVVLIVIVSKPLYRWLLAVPALYLAAMAWEDILVDNSSVARQILLGASLIVMMARRPEGLLGSRRVELV